MKMKKHLVSLILICTMILSMMPTTAFAIENESLKPINIRVNLKNEPYGVQLDSLSFSWALDGSRDNIVQQAYRIVISKTRDDIQKEEYIYDSGFVASKQSAGIRPTGIILEENSIYYWCVQIKTKTGEESLFSDPQCFVTEIGNEWEDKSAIWADSDSYFSFLRTEFVLPVEKTLDKAILSVTSKTTGASKGGEKTRQYVYNVYLNGEFAGLGPAGMYNNTHQYNSFDVTQLIKNGENAIGVINYDVTTNRKFLLQLTAYYTDGTSEVLTNSAADANNWKGYSGYEVFGEERNNFIHAYNGSQYTAAAENLDATKYPFGFSETKFNDSLWTSVVVDKDYFSNLRLESYSGDRVGREYIPVSKVVDKGNGNYFIDLGREIIGGIQLSLDNTSGSTAVIEIRSGEELSGTNTVKYKMRTSNVYCEYWTLAEGQQTMENTGMKGFRYVEILNCPVVLTEQNIKGVAIRKPFSEDASSFTSSNSDLNRIYDFLKYSIQATNQDLYVDSQTRERLAYEGDAFINALSSYSFDSDYALARYSIQYLLYERTWPAEYPVYMIQAAWQNYLYTGDITTLEQYYSLLKKILPSDSYWDSGKGLYKTYKGSATGGTNAMLVDWPSSDRDGYQFDTYNTVWNAVVYGGLTDMEKIASILGKSGDALAFSSRAEALKTGMIKHLFDSTEGAYRDGLDSSGAVLNHYAEHATVFPLYYGVYEDQEMANQMIAYVKSKGNKTSVYGTFFLLNGLYYSNGGDTAMDMLLSRNGNHNYLHVMDGLGATIATEAWDPSVKSNMTYSHAWGTGGASAIVRGMFGIIPTTAGFETFDVCLQPGSVDNAEVSVPTVKGTISVSYSFEDEDLQTSLSIPHNTMATIKIPVSTVADQILVDGEKVEAAKKNEYWEIELGSGIHKILRSSPPYLTGQVTDKWGNALSDVSALLYRGDEVNHCLETTTGKDGRFKLPIDGAGEYHVEFVASGYITVNSDVVEFKSQSMDIGQIMMKKQKVDADEADFNKDCFTDLRDYVMLMHHYGMNAPEYDLNYDGIIDSDDRRLFMQIYQ